MSYPSHVINSIFFGIVHMEIKKEKKKYLKRKKTVFLLGEKYDFTQP